MMLHSVIKFFRCNININNHCWLRGFIIKSVTKSCEWTGIWNSLVTVYLVYLFLHIKLLDSTDARNYVYFGFSWHGSNLTGYILLVNHMSKQNQCVWKSQSNMSFFCLELFCHSMFFCFWLFIFSYRCSFRVLCDHHMYVIFGLMSVPREILNYLSILIIVLGLLRINAMDLKFWRRKFEIAIKRIVKVKDSIEGR